MPEMSGRQCFHALKAIAPSVPIFLASGFTQEELIEDLTRNGAATFLKKPFGLGSLREAVARARGESIVARARDRAP